MKIQIIGDGAFGTFLKELLAPHCEISNSADTIILAVPASAYDECARNLCHDPRGEYPKPHLVNVCSIQSTTTQTLLRYTDRVTSIHPLFGKRTPADKRNSILTHTFTGVTNDVWFDDQTENDFLEIFRKVSAVWRNNEDGIYFTPQSHDIHMAKTHASAVRAAKQLKVFTDRVANVPDELIPNSFRLMRQFIQTLEDMPQGTIESIMANPYI